MATPLEELLARHPFPAEHAGERRLDFLWQLDLPLTPAELWPIVADSSRLNRALGRAEMKFWERDGRRWGSSKLGGLHHWRRPATSPARSRPRCRPRWTLFSDT